MKFLRVYIKNFKGLSGVKIADLDKSTTLLTGPNGFGKTTIFDAIELCLTGGLHRTKVKENVTKDLKDYKKPFFQNDVKDEVTLKLLLENKRGEKLVIVRHLHKEAAKRPKVSGKKNKANEFRILNLYTEKISAFNQESFDLDNAESITQKQISQFFEFADENIDIRSIYPIFNYLQQEETTFFLKKSEHDRKSSLGFLLRTDTQENKHKLISDKYNKLFALRKVFGDKLLTIEPNLVEKIEYEKIFSEQSVDFDKENPFIGVEDDNLKIMLERFLAKLSELTEFIKNFSPSEFLLKEKSEKITSLIIKSNEFQEHYVLQKFLQDDEFNKLKSLLSDINNNELIENYILQNVTKQSDHVVVVNQVFDDINKFRSAKSIDKWGALKPLVNSFFPEKLASYKSMLSLRESLSANLKGLNKSIHEIKSTIKDLEEHYLKVQEKEDICKCPYCGSKFDGLDQLSSSMKERLTAFDSLAGENILDLQQLSVSFENEITRPITKKIKEFEKSNSEYEKLMVQSLVKYGSIQRDFSNIDRLLGQTSKYKWERISDIKKLNDDRDAIQNKLKALFPVADDVWNKIIKHRSKSYQQAYELTGKLDISCEIIKVQEDSRVELTTLEEYLNTFSKAISDCHSQIKYDPASSEDPKNLFATYFKSDSRLFNLLTLDSIESKKAYLNYIVSSRESEQYKLIERKVDELTIIIDKLERLKGIYADEIKKYKKEMIKRIQVPFFIYTAKILQNYQQGMGIFIFVKDDSAIRFLANGDSDHDIMHHLSSGQLAVVALAFCLAVNKTFEISPNLKFLAIDDPVQEMDALNIHSFIDLVRTELSNEYQLIFSTHDYDNALFMKYKLEKTNENSVDLIDVQQRFFPPLSTE